MTDTEIRLLNSNGLSADARVIGLYIRTKGPGEHEIEREEFEDLLSPDAGKSRVQRALGQLKRAGWISRRPGGRGHNDRFSFRDPETRQVSDEDSSRPQRQVSDSGSNGKHLNADSSRRQQQLNAAPSSTGTTPSTTTSRARTPVNGSAPERDLERLRAFLGEHREAADLFDRSAEHSATWAGAIYGAFGPKATRERIYNGLPPEERPPALAAAIQDYAGEGKPYNNRLFEGFLRDEVKRRKRGDDDGDGAGTGGANRGAASGGGGSEEEYGHLG